MPAADREARYRALGAERPSEEPSAQARDLLGGKGLPYRRSGDLLFLHALPTEGGRPLLTGKVGGEVTLEEGHRAARRAAINALATAREALGSLDVIDKIVQLTGFIASAPGFTDQPRVLNGATDLFVEVLGSDGEHNRAAIGCVSLPGDVPVELVVTIQVRS
jgi:enamine deaminase RidA (YjgF/YER057c/UK114 family)